VSKNEYCGVLTTQCL